MPESYDSHWHRPAPPVVGAVEELADAIRAALVMLRKDQRYATAERLERALEKLEGKTG